jgi:hypothetical protein
MMIPRSSLFLIFCFLCFNVFAQRYSYNKWDAALVEHANTAKSVDYMNQDEKKVILYINLVRINPKLFSETYLQQYIDSLRVNNSLHSDEYSYIVSLQKDLGSIEKRKALLPLKELHESANALAQAMGESGSTGHGNYNKRFSKVMKETNCYKTGEDCDYGFEAPLDIVLHLLIDNGVPDLGHRKNILDKDFTNIGTSIKPHKKYGWNCVIDFVGR